MQIFSIIDECCLIVAKCLLGLPFAFSNHGCALIPTLLRTKLVAQSLLLLRMLLNVILFLFDVSLGVESISVISQF